MRTDELIHSLTADLRPVSPLSCSRGIMVSLAAGSPVALLLLVFGLGGQMDFGHATHGWSLWVKWLYTAPICAGAIIAAHALSRPAVTLPANSFAAILSVVMLASLAVSEMSHSATSIWPSLWLGQSWRACSWRILLLSIPIFAAMIWKVRQAAPTRLRLAGAAVGLASAAAAATLYAIGCAETSACFILAWYSLAIAVSATAGALLGPVLLRW